MNKLLRKAARAMGYDLVPRSRGKTRQPPPDISDADRAVLERIAPYTMTSIDRQISLIQAVRHIVRQNIAGCFAECGVWRGGSAMAMALTLAQEGDTTRDIYLYDTFEGMTPPASVDRTFDGTAAQVHLERDADKTGVHWAVADFDAVQQNMASTGYPSGHIHYAKGPVETTIPNQSPPEPIALLRLDTDWYESTKHELTHLFPLLCEGGILIVDDYGYWKGARKAVDEYLAGLERKFFLHRIDDTGRLLVKK